MTVELNEQWLVGVGVFSWLVLATLLARWTYRSTRRNNLDLPGLLALMAFLVMPLTLVVWLCVVGNEDRKGGSDTPRAG